jgi:hypothetical protein
VRPPKDALHDLGRVREFLELVPAEALDPGRKSLDAALAAALEQASAFRRRVQHGRAPVPGVGPAPHEPLPLETADDGAHGRRPNLLGARKLRQRPWPAEDEHGECGQASGAEARLRVRAAHASKEVDRRRVQSVGGLG